MGLFFANKRQAPSSLPPGRKLALLEAWQYINDSILMAHKSGDHFVCFLENNNYPLRGIGLNFSPIAAHLFPLLLECTACFASLKILPEGAKKRVIEHKINNEMRSGNSKGKNNEDKTINLEVSIEDNKGGSSITIRFVKGHKKAHYAQLPDDEFLWDRPCT